MTEPNINAQIAARVRQLRAQHGLSIEALAEVSGVSRSMISLIERGETSPTAVLLEKLAAGLETTLAGLFEKPSAPADPLSRQADQTLWRDPASGYVRRNVSPSGYPTPIQIVEVVFPPDAHVAYESGKRRPLIHHQVWVLDGTIEVRLGEEPYMLHGGDCLAFALDRPIRYRNPTHRPARYAVVIVAGPHQSETVL